MKKDIYSESLKLHKKLKGKLDVKSKVKLKSRKDLSLLYTPGVAQASKEIAKNKEKIYAYTGKGNTIAVVSDGSAVLGLGNIGPEGALPVMEGKCILFKELAGIDAFPICLNTQDVDEICNCVKNIEPTFGGINLEDISSPRCFLIEEKLKKTLDMPVFHDDQHGTAVVVFAALINALKLTKRKLSEIKAVINGAGAAGIAIAKFLLNAGVKDILVCDRNGIIYKGRKKNMNFIKEKIALLTNPRSLKGGLKDAVYSRNLFIGVSAPNCLSKEMIKTMEKDPIIFAMANPVPEVMPEEAKKAGVRIIGTGRSDLPNQINNVLGFPGIFRGALDVRARVINEPMKLAASYAIASIIPQHKLSEDYFIPTPLDRSVVPEVVSRVAEAAIESKVARVNILRGKKCC
jgi:malate dehydrogenase (oxaloacetate-decarboxylating)